MTELIGIATWNFSEGTLAERIERFVGMGYNAVSLNTIDAAPLARGEMPEAEAAILWHSVPVTIHGGLGPKGLPIDRGRILTDFRAYCDWHARTGLLVSVNYDAATQKTGSGETRFRCEEMRDTLAEMLSMSGGMGFTVGIEDWPRTSEDLAVVESLRAHPHLGMLIDLGHLNMRIAKSDDPDQPFLIEAAREYLANMVLPVNELHVHNNDGAKDLHAPPEVGTSDLRALSRLLHDTGKLALRGASCVSTIELVPAWCGLMEAEGWSAAAEALGFWRNALTA